MVRSTRESTVLQVDSMESLPEVNTLTRFDKTALIGTKNARGKIIDQRGLLDAKFGHL